MLAALVAFASAQGYGRQVRRGYGQAQVHARPQSYAPVQVHARPQAYAPVQVHARPQTYGNEYVSSRIIKLPALLKKK